MIQGLKESARQARCQARLYGNAETEHTVEFNEFAEFLDCIADQLEGERREKIEQKKGQRKK